MTHQRLLPYLSLVIGLTAVLSAHAEPSRPVTRFVDHFQVAGAPKYAVFVSYFDGLAATPATLDYDLSRLKDNASGIRVFPNWWSWNSNVGLGLSDACNACYFTNTTLFAPDGSVRAPG